MRVRYATSPILEAGYGAGRVERPNNSRVGRQVHPVEAFHVIRGEFPLAALQLWESVGNFCYVVMSVAVFSITTH